MSKYRIDDPNDDAGYTVVDTDKAVASWEEDTYFDGRNKISRATGDQWLHEKLHLSRNRRYYIESWSNWQGSKPSARFVEAVEAARWLVLNGEELPEDLEKFEKEAVE